MLRGYRGVIFAIGVSLACPYQWQEAAAHQADDHRGEQGQLNRIAAALEKLPPSGEPDRGCRQGQDNRESDLCAQWKAADAASDSAWWSMGTFYATIAGIGVGFLTLIAAAFAAWYARHAAEAAKASYNAFVAVEGAKMMVVVEPRIASRNDDDIGVTPIFSAVNVGRAKAVPTAINYEIADNAMCPETFPKSHPLNPAIAQELARFDIRLPEAIHSDRFYVKGELIYDDPISRSHRTTFCFLVERDRNADGPFDLVRYSHARGDDWPDDT